ncbi:MAG: trypsin-like peptidase domain-containing protein [Thiolinea sp.]
MINMVVGANLALTGQHWSFTVRFPVNMRHDLALALLPVNEAKQLVATPLLSHAANAAWCKCELNADGTSYTTQLDVSQLPNNSITRLSVVIYRYGARGPVDVGQTAIFRSEGAFTHTLPLAGVTASALVIGEFYLKNGAWKIRALAETSAYGLAAMGRRMGMEIDERSPFTAPSGNGANQPDSWSGSAFLVAPNVFMTNAHVVEGARQIVLSSLQGKVEAQVILSDENNDLALVRAPSPSHIQPLTFRREPIGLAENITTLGYPLASLMGSGIQVTQGVISGLFGAHNDIRLLQFTAPIQPGSSGSPLLDSTGAVLGVVSSSFANAQNMNFAVRNVLAIALMEATQTPYTWQASDKTLTAAQIVTQAQQSIWRVECVT